MPSYTPLDVAEWMRKKLEQASLLYQETVVYEIEQKFGDEFTYDNENGNLAIDKRVLKAFRDLTGDTVVWERGDRAWRKRNKHDLPGRQQD